MAAGGIRLLVAGTDGSDVEHAAGVASLAGYAVTPVVSDAMSLASVEAHAHDLLLLYWPSGLSLSGQTQPLRLLLEDVPAVVVLASVHAGERRWLLRDDDVATLIAPTSDAELLYRLEQAYRGSRRFLHEMLDEDSVLRFLRGMEETRRAPLLPVSAPERRCGHLYPLVLQHFGSTSLDREFLERLADLGLLERFVANRVRLCSSCRQVWLNFREVCPACRSVTIVAVELLHHFTCGHVAPVDAFRSGAVLQCPKCGGILRHIGVDYERPGESRHCGTCGIDFPEPAVEAECLACAMSSVPEETVAYPIYRYELTPLADQAMEEGRIIAAPLENILRSRETGLHNRRYFEHELSREHARWRRYKVPYSVVLVRFVELDAMLRERPEPVEEFLHEVHAHILEGLRALDIRCVWTANELALLLPSTPAEGAAVVGLRIKEYVPRAGEIVGVGHPRVGIGWATPGEQHADAEAVVAVAAEGAADA